VGGQDIVNRSALLYIENLYKRYGDKLVLENVDLAVREGEFCVVVGPSGCGKSTLFRIILGQETASEGEVLIDGRPVGVPAPDRGIVYQRYSLYPHLTVVENVMLGRMLGPGLLERRRRRSEFREEAMTYLERVRLAAHADKYPHELSGGMQQRVAIVQALVRKPRILMMDEPFGALDPDTREDMQLFMLELWDQQRMTIFFVTHDMGEAAFLGTRVLALSQYYTDDRGSAATRGSRIVGDYPLPNAVYSTKVKNSPEFVQLTDEIRRVGFDPDKLRHVDQFNLKHPDSFQTLTIEESHHNGVAA
jgi:NitT/TauT family transport system ATP-binding protein